MKCKWAKKVNEIINWNVNEIKEVSSVSYLFVRPSSSRSFNFFSIKWPFDCLTRCFPANKIDHFLTTKNIPCLKYIGYFGITSFWKFGLPSKLKPPTLYSEGGPDVIPPFLPFPPRNRFPPLCLLCGNVAFLGGVAVCEVGCFFLGIWCCRVVFLISHWMDGDGRPSWAPFGCVTDDRRGGTAEPFPRVLLPAARPPRRGEKPSTLSSVEPPSQLIKPPNEDVRENPIWGNSIWLT